MYDSSMNQSRSDQATGRFDPLDDEPSRLAESSPLRRRIMAGAEAVNPPITEHHEHATDFGVQYATIAFLDGTVAGRLECAESLGNVVIGRGSLAEIQIHDRFVHRVHSEIYWDAELRSHVITHAGGSNSTYVNLQRVDGPTRLVDGSRIRIGKTELVYRRIFYPGYPGR